MTRPPVKVEFGFGSTWRTEPGSITWTNHTSRVMDRRGPITIDRGATPFLDRADTGRIDLTLRNSDRRFDQNHASSPHVGQLKPGVPMRITSSPLGAAIPVGYGYVKSWPQRYDRGNRSAYVPIGAWDGFDKLSRAKIPQAPYPLEVLADAPSAYWRLDEPEGNVMLDSSDHGADGMFDNASLGEDPLIADGTGHSARFEHVGDNRGQFIGEGLPTAAPVTLEAWVRFDRDLAQTHVILVCQRDNAFGSGLVLSVESAATGSPNGELVINFAGLGGFYKARGHTRVDDGEVHHVVMTMATTAAVDIKLYVDGVVQTKTVISGATGGTWTGHRMWCVGNVAASSAFDFGIGGNVDEAAIYPSVLSAARITAHYQAGALALSGQRSNERAAYILDSLGWPTGLRSLDTGRSILGPAMFQAGDGALGYLQQIADTEDALLHMTADGKVRLPDRYWRYQNTAATVPQITFTDDGSGVNVSEFELEPADDELIVNVARFTRRGGVEQVAEDNTSSDVYGEVDLQRSDLLHQNDGLTLSQAQWTVATRSQPAPRVPVVTIKLHKLPAARQAQILALDLGHRVACARTPQKVGTAFSINCVVAGIRHRVSAVEWIVELYLGPAPNNTVQLFTLGVSQLGGTHILAY